MAPDKRHITLLQLQTMIKTQLDQQFALPLWVVAEISEMKVNYSGHCYLELVEKGGDNQVPCAKTSAVIWRSAYGAISSYFSSATGGELRVGLKVLLKVAVNYHQLYGLSLQIQDIDPMYTMGDMERQRQLTIERLLSDGVYDMNRTLGLPPIIQRIAVVSSRNAAGYQDFINELGRAPYYFAIELFDAFMQGNDAERSIVDALEQIAARMDEFDTVVIIRGGGSQSDLACFNSYRLCSHIAQFPLPVITGIGHDKDQSVADLVAAVALKTPTAVATMLVDSLMEVDNYFDTLHDNLLQVTVGALDTQKRRVHSASISLSQVSTRLTHSLAMRLERLSSEIIRRHEALITSRQNGLQTLQAAMTQRIQTLLLRQTNRLDVAHRLVDSHRPERILSLGFAIVRREAIALKTSTDIEIGQKVNITLARGILEAEVTKKSVK